MSVRALCLAAWFLVAVLPGAARDKTDIIVMENGDRLTGEVKGLRAGVLYVSLPYVDGTIQIEWSKVSRLESSQLFIVQTQDGSLYTGTLATATSGAGRPMRLEVTSEAKPNVVIERIGVVGLQETSDTFFKRLSGDLNVGVVYSKGNNSTQYSIGSGVEYRRERWGSEATFASNLSASTGSTTSTRNQLNLNAYRVLPRRKNYFYEGFSEFLQSSVQGIKLQTTLGGGLGRFLKNTNRTRLTVLGGLAWQSTHYEQSSVTLAAQEVAAGVVATDLRVFMFNKTNLSVTAGLFPAMSGPSRVRFNTNASYYVKIFGDLSWNLSFYGSWDTRPPPNFSGSDYGYSSGLKWTFGFK
jgi:Protein of unknown function, DUF481